MKPKHKIHRGRFAAMRDGGSLSPAIPTILFNSAITGFNDERDGCVLSVHRFVFVTYRIFYQIDAARTCRIISFQSRNCA